MTGRIVATVAAMVLAAHVSVVAGKEQQEDLTGKVRQLEERVKQLEQLVLPLKDEMQAKARNARLEARAEARAKQDETLYSLEEREEIDRLYYVANHKWASPKAQASLKKLVGNEKYAKSNRAGCAVLYLGQWATTGKESEEYYKRAIKDFNDCWYGDGVQVGALARYFLAQYYQENGKAAEAAALCDEIRKDFPEAVDHDGTLLVTELPK